MSRLKHVGAAIALAVSLPVVTQAETPAPTSVEDAFLDILPKTVVPDEIQPIPGAVNEEFRNCREFWPPEYMLSQKGSEARAYRDIYGFVKVNNVLGARDCSCMGKVAAWADVESVATSIRKRTGKSKLVWQDTEGLFDASNELFPVAEAMCGGSF